MGDLDTLCQVKGCGLLVSLTGAWVLGKLARDSRIPEQAGRSRWNSVFLEIAVWSPRR